MFNSNHYHIGKRKRRKFKNRDWSNNLKNLDQCEVGEKVRVHSLRMKGHKSKRLMDMGLLPGTIIEISRIAPFGDPVAIKLRGFQMSFRKKEAEEIIVELL